MAERVLRLKSTASAYEWRDGSYRYRGKLLLPEEAVQVIRRFRTRNVDGRHHDRYRLKMVRVRVPALDLDEVIVEASALHSQSW